MNHQKQEVWVLNRIHKGLFTVPVSFHSSQNAAKCAANQFLLTNESLQWSDILICQAEINNANASSSADKIKMLNGFDALSEELLQKKFDLVPRSELIQDNCRYYYEVMLARGRFICENPSLVALFSTKEAAEAAIPELFPGGASYFIQRSIVSDSNSRMNYEVYYPTRHLASSYQFGELGSSTTDKSFELEEDAISFSKLMDMQYTNALLNRETLTGRHSVRMMNTRHLRTPFSREQGSVLRVSVQVQDPHHRDCFTDYSVPVGQFRCIKTAYEYCRMLFQHLPVVLTMHINQSGWNRDQYPFINEDFSFSGPGYKLFPGLLKHLQYCYDPVRIDKSKEYWVRNTQGEMISVPAETFAAVYLPKILSSNDGKSEREIARAILFDDYASAFINKETNEVFFCGEYTTRVNPIYWNSRGKWVCFGSDFVRHFTSQDEHDSAACYLWSRPKWANKATQNGVIIPEDIRESVQASLVSYRGY